MDTQITPVINFEQNNAYKFLTEIQHLPYNYREIPSIRHSSVWRVMFIDIAIRNISEHGIICII